MSLEMIEGREIAGRYRVERVLGQGGMGMVLRARHLWTGRAVALKVILPELASSGGAAARFLREAQTAASLRHPNVVDILDMGRAEDGTLYLAMELLEGEPLSARLARVGKLAPDEALTLLLPILDALALAHEHGLVHRDIKPDNIFLSTGSGPLTPKLLDFGIVRAFRAEGEKLTATGMVLGTPGYMAPEQVAGDPAGPPADVWAIGTVLFEALSGRPPYDFTSALGWMTRVITEPAPSLSSVAPEIAGELAALVDRCLLREPSARFSDAGALGRALRARTTDALARTVALPSLVPGRIAPRPSEPSPSKPSDSAPPPTRPLARVQPTMTGEGRGRMALVVVSMLLGAGGAIAWWASGSHSVAPERAALASIDPASDAGTPDGGASERAGTSTGERTATKARPAPERTAPTTPPPPVEVHATEGARADRPSPDRPDRSSPDRASPERTPTDRTTRGVGRRAPRTTPEDM